MDDIDRRNTHDIGDDFKSIFEDVFKRGKEGGEETKRRPSLCLSESIEDIHNIPRRQTNSNSESSDKTSSTTSEIDTPRGSVLKALVDRFRNGSPKMRSNRRTPQLWWLPPTPTNKNRPESSVYPQTPERTSNRLNKFDTIRSESFNTYKRDQTLNTSLSDYQQHHIPNIKNLFPTSPSLTTSAWDDLGGSPTLPLLSSIEDEVDVEALLSNWRRKQAMKEDLIQDDNLDSFLREEGLIASSVSTQASDSTVQEASRNVRSRRPIVSRNNQSVKKPKFSGSNTLDIKQVSKQHCNNLLATERPARGSLREERLSAERAVRAQKLNLSKGWSQKKQNRRPIKIAITRKNPRDEHVPVELSTTDSESNDESSSYSTSSSLPNSRPEKTKIEISEQQNRALTVPSIETNNKLSKLPMTLRSRLAAELKKCGARQPEEIDKVLRRVLDRASEDEVREVIRLREEVLHKKTNKKTLEKKKNKIEVVARKSSWPNFDKDEEIAELLKEIKMIRKQALQFFII